MELEPFHLERFFAQHEFSARHLLCCSDCESLAVGDLLAREPDGAETLNNLWLGYTETSGDPALRAEIADLYAGIDPDQVLVHAGAEEAIFNFMQVTLSAGDHVVVHWPGYQSLAAVARGLGCDVTLWRTGPADHWQLDLEWLRRQLRPQTRAVIVNCPHNPTGYVMDRAALAELTALADEHGFLIFSDEVYRGLEHHARTRLPAACDLSDRALSLGVMSKTYGLAGLRIGWIATRNHQVLEKMKGFKDYTTICNSAPSEFLATLALRQRDHIVARNMEIIRTNLDYLDAFFARHRSRFVWQRPVAGPIAFPRLASDMDATDFCAKLVDRAGVLLLPGALIDEAYRSHFRIGFGRLDLPTCLQQVDDFLAEGY